MEYPIGPSRAVQPRMSRPLADAMRALSEDSSSAAHTAAAAALAAGAPPPQRRAILRRRLADNARVVQLRGVFSAFDGDGDGALGGAELPRALLALGVQPTEGTLAHFAAAAAMATEARGAGTNGGRAPPPPPVTLDAYIRATMALDASDVATTESDILQALRVFDERGTGSVALPVLLHLLCDVTLRAGSALTLEEVRRLSIDDDSARGDRARHIEPRAPCPPAPQAHELLKMTGVITPAQLASRPSAAELSSLQVAYTPLVKMLAFPLPRTRACT